MYTLLGRFRLLGNLWLLLRHWGNLAAARHTSGDICFFLRCNEVVGLFDNFFLFVYLEDFCFNRFLYFFYWGLLMDTPVDFKCSLFLSHVDNNRLLCFKYHFIFCFNTILLWFKCNYISFDDIFGSGRHAIRLLWLSCWGNFSLRLLLSLRTIWCCFTGAHSEFRVL